MPGKPCSCRRWRLYASAWCLGSHKFNDDDSLGFRVMKRFKQDPLLEEMIGMVLQI